MSSAKCFSSDERNGEVENGLLARSRVSVKFFVKIYFRLYERRASPSLARSGY